jgi:hypothetical protein
MHCVVHNLRAAACRADDEAKATGKKCDALENCGTQLQKCFAVAMQGTGALVAVLFNIHTMLARANPQV